MQACHFQHVRREGNKLAHALARRAVSSADFDVWVEELPSDLLFSQKKKKNHLNQLSFILQSNDNK